MIKGIERRGLSARSLSSSKVLAFARGDASHGKHIDSKIAFGMPFMPLGGGPGGLALGRATWTSYIHKYYRYLL